MNLRLLLLGLVSCSATKMESAVLYTVSLDTSPLIGHSAAPFSLNFQLNDGSGLGNANNTARLFNFSFGAGGSTGLPMLVGGASGNLASEILLTDSGFLNSFTQEFVAGAALSFSLELSVVGELGPQPDQFSMAILDQSGFELPYASPFYAALVIDIFDGSHLVQTFPTDPTIPPFGGGDGVSMVSPVVMSPIPEPDTTFTIALALLGGTLLNRYSNWQKRNPKKLREQATELERRLTPD